MDKMDQDIIFLVIRQIISRYVWFKLTLGVPVPGLDSAGEAEVFVPGWTVVVPPVPPP